MKLESIEFGAGEVRKGRGGNPKTIDSNILLTNAELEEGYLALDFEFTATYAPGNDSIRISGMAIFSGKETKKAHAEWVKSKAITGEQGELILNAIHYGSSMNAVLLAKAFNMMPPVVLPTLKIRKKAAKKKK
jgi:hypothetical protein